MVQRISMAIPSIGLAVLQVLWREQTIRTNCSKQTPTKKATGGHTYKTPEGTAILRERLT